MIHIGKWAALIGGVCLLLTVTLLAKARQESPDENWMIVRIRDLGPNPQARLYKAHVTLGMAEPLTPSMQIKYNYGWVDDGHKFLVAVEEPPTPYPFYPLYTVSYPWGKVERLFAEDVALLSISPDRTHLAYLTVRNGATSGPLHIEIRLSRVDGTDSRLLTSVETNESLSYVYPILNRVRWAPQNDWVLWLEEHTDGFSIWRDRYAGGEPTPLVTVADETLFSLYNASPDGEWFAFEQESSTGQINLYGINLTTAEIRLYAADDALSFYFHEWSPDSQWLFYTSNRGDLWKIAADGQSEPTRINPHAADDVAVSIIRWSEDRQWFYIISLAAGNPLLARVNLITNESQEIPLPADTEFRILYAELDKNTLLVGAYRFKEGYELYRLSLADYQLTRLATDAYDETPVALSPDKKWVIFSRFDAQGSYGLYRIPVEGGAAEPILGIHHPTAAIESFGSWISPVALPWEQGRLQGIGLGLIVLALSIVGLWYYRA